ncbi:putative F-box/LRR-repeat protein [Tripterygium wilfordii]|uniref:Putative F-box/LRR-repeat protein n=1 Tax=Tripterygium wilfordii TaxID=458696 RepID=A0A7J7C1D7_TRIWF|nr:putative F-box/LRR-repeat protein At1g56400 [Tripterygium wilfordii]KAF5727970.1 putative F-box/LRR-repeat protein [Tripterygium wilfordii]
MADHDHGTIDFFSRLTNLMLVYIISFLPFKDAARTSVLSKRWYQVWHSTRNVEFNENFFVKPGDEESEEITEKQRRAFVDFTRRWMLTYNGEVIDTLSLTFSRPRKFSSEMNECINFAITRNVQRLVLDFSDPTTVHRGVFELPPFVYGHEGLKSLKLFSCNFDVSRLNNFNALKELSLGWIKVSMSTIKDLLRKCPSLESLSLKNCSSVDHIEISAPDLRLRSLVFDKCELDQPYLMIKAPNLRVLKYSGDLPTFEFWRPESLVEADLDFASETEFEEVGDLVQEILREIACVQVLTVCSYLLQVIPSGTEPLGMEVALNVRHLILKTELHSNVFFGIKFMLKSCPVLETLTIQLGPARMFSDYEPPFVLRPRVFWKGSQVVFDCLANTLKVVEVQNFKGSENEINLLNYLIKLGKVLEGLKLCVSKEDNGAGENPELYRERALEVLQIRRASPTLRIDIV